MQNGRREKRTECGDVQMALPWPARAPVVCCFRVHLPWPRDVAENGEVLSETGERPLRPALYCHGDGCRCSLATALSYYS